MAPPTHTPGVKIIHAALFRMGTHFFAKAYRTLGFKTFHALDDDNNGMSSNEMWLGVERAAEATWPHTPDARPRDPFSRADWDALWGNQYDAVTDAAGFFTLELVRAYPDAKVVVVQRDFETWWPSFKSQVVKWMFMPGFGIVMFLGDKLDGNRAAHAVFKMVYGFFDAQKPEEIEPKAREVYDEFYRDVRAVVPPGQLLEYRLGDGWGPLCDFLGKDVPDIPFPYGNRKAEHDAVQWKQLTGFLMKAMGKLSMFGVAVAVLVGTYSWYIH